MRAHVGGGGGGGRLICPTVVELLGWYEPVVYIVHLWYCEFVGSIDNVNYHENILANYYKNYVESL